MISLIKSATGNIYLVEYTHHSLHKTFKVLNRTNIVQPETCTLIHVGLVCNFAHTLLKNYLTIEEALEDNFVEML